MLKVRACGALIAVVLATLLVSNHLQQYWVTAFAEGPESSGGWWSPRWLAMTWGWDVLVTFGASLVLAVMLLRTSRIWWYVGFGVIYAVVRFFGEGGCKGSDTDVGFTLWRYGSYIVSVAGAILGGVVALALAAWRRRLTIVGGGRETR
jgi:hypothetical protein